MPDTGAPWNISYVASSDLVADWPTDNETMADSIADALDVIADAGIGSNVVQAIKTDTFSTSSATYVDVTDLSVTITPSSDTSKVLLIASLAGTSGDATGAGFYWRFTGGNTAGFVGDAAGDRQQAISGTSQAVAFQTTYGMLSWVASYLDSPATTSATTYKVQINRGNTSSAVINKSSLDTNSAVYGRGASSLIAIEVRA